MFVVGVLLKRMLEEKEAQGSAKPLVFVVNSATPRARITSETAVALSPVSAAAWEGLAYHSMMGVDLFESPGTAFRRARDAAQRALALDQARAGAWSVLGQVRHWFDRDLRGAEEAHRRAVSLDPDSAAGERLYACIALGMAATAIDGYGQFRERVLPALANELDRQVLADGGHVSRHPGAMIEPLIDLISLVTCLRAQRLAVPERITAAITRAPS